jgi:subtilisin-like proprotein convertase family protein
MNIVKDCVMKKTLLVGILALVAIQPGRAALYSYSGSSYSIPDGNFSGVASTITVSGENASLTDIKVNLDVSGGLIGNLYGYLSYNGTALVLLNRVGVGTINDGTSYGSLGTSLAITLLSSGADVHWTTGNLTGEYLADGRDLDPVSATASFNASGTQNLNTSFGGINPNGVWTLFFADASGGGGTSMVNGWSLDITAVPERTTWALVIFGGLGGVCGLLRWRLRKKPAAV